MQYFKKLWSNAKRAKDLQEKYYKATSTVGMFGVILSIPLTIIGFLALTLQFGSNSLITIALILPLFAGSLLIGIHFAALFAALFMVIKGNLNWREAINYVIYSDYPSRWLK